LLPAYIVNEIVLCGMKAYSQLANISSARRDPLTTLMFVNFVRQVLPKDNP
jgi:hypothetical protein